MEQAQQNTAQELTAQAIPQQAVEDACFHSLGLIGRNCEYLEQHLARVGADAQSLQAVSDISAATAKLERTINELLSALEFLRAGQPPKLYPLDLCELLQQVAAQADMVRAQLGSPWSWTTAAGRPAVCWLTGMMWSCCVCICCPTPCVPAARAAR